MSEGIEISVEIQDKAVQAMLARAVVRFADMKPAFEMIGERLVSSTQERAERSVAPDESPWPSLKAATIKSKEKRGFPDPAKPLLGPRMLKSVHPEASAMGVKVGTNVKSKRGYLYPAVHQFGTKDGTVPKREWLGISVSDEAAIHGILAAYLGVM